MNDAKYGKGFAFRMTILVGLLVLVAAGLYYDRAILAPQTQKTIDAAFDLKNQKDPGVPISKKEVAETIGFAAATTEEKDGYEIETYQFSRALPFIKGDYVNAIYENGSLVNLLHNKPFSEDAVKHKIEFEAPENYTGNYPAMGGVPGGGDPGGGGDDDDADDADVDDSDSDDSDSDEDVEDSK